MDKLVEVLKAILPKDQLNEAIAAVQEILDAKARELEQEYNERLEEAYAELAQEVKDNEKIAEQGYQEAYTIITDLRNRLETQRGEFEQALEEGYEEAYQMILAERGKNENLEVDMYEAYNQRTEKVKKYIVSKIDEFLQNKGQEIYEQARVDLANDPRLVEDRIALERVAEAVSHVAEGNFNVVSTKKLTEAQKRIEELESAKKLLEARNIRISTENNRLLEMTRTQGTVISENKQHDKKERLEKARTVQGRGQMFTEGEAIIPEPGTNGRGIQPSRRQQVDNNELLSQFDEATLNTMQVLSGVKKSEYED